MKRGEDRRVQRTRKALIDAYDQLILEDNILKITVPRLIERANVGRSTFYDHFQNIGELHLRSLGRLFLPLAERILAGDQKAVEYLLAHIWENRRRARSIFNGSGIDQATRLLADILTPQLQQRDIRDDVPIQLISGQLAAAILSPIRSWINAEAWCPPEDLSDLICKVNGAMLESAANSRGQT